METYPHLRLREGASHLIDLPWQQPLERWQAEGVAFRELRIGPSRHLVRFLDSGLTVYALKEEPLDIARAEFDVLRRLEDTGLPAVATIGLSESPQRRTGILVTEYLRHSLQYRRLLMRVQRGPSAHRERLLDAMAWLLAELHRAGVYWGDCSLANTLFRRDGDRIQAYLVDAETSEIHPALSDGQRAHDLDVAVENVGFGLADLAAELGYVDWDDAVVAAESVRTRYAGLWAELHETPELRAGDRRAVEGRIRRLHEMGFSVDEIELEPGTSAGRVRLRLAVANRRYHARTLARLTGVQALENQARLLLNDLREYQLWLAWNERPGLDEAAGAESWLNDVFEVTVSRIEGHVGVGRDLVQAYCDLLEHKWLMSEQAGGDVGLEAALVSYLNLGAPAPESPEAVA